MAALYSPASILFAAFFDVLQANSNIGIKGKRSLMLNLIEIKYYFGIKVVKLDDSLKGMSVEGCLFCLESYNLVLKHINHKCPLLEIPF
jgi:hypothetical protein